MTTPGRTSPLLRAAAGVAVLSLTLFGVAPAPAEAVARTAPRQSAPESRPLLPTTEDAKISPALSTVRLDSRTVDDALAAIAEAQLAIDDLIDARLSARHAVDAAHESVARARAREAIASASATSLATRTAVVEEAVVSLAVEDFMGEQRTDRYASIIDPSIGAQPQGRAAVAQTTLDTLISDRNLLRDRLSAAVDSLETARQRAVEAEQSLDLARDVVTKLDEAFDRWTGLRLAAQQRLAAGRVLARVAGADFPLVALDAYWKAGQRAQDRGCSLEWWALAGISRVEGVHGTFGGSQLDTEGNTTRKIIGIPLNGENETLEILDSDGGRLDGDLTFDRAVGPMQFIPSTWRIVGADGNDDGVADPHNLYDASAAAADYLCDTPARLDSDSGLLVALLRYNRSVEYGKTVLGFARGYEADIEVDVG